MALHCGFVRLLARHVSVQAPFSSLHVKKAYNAMVNIVFTNGGLSRSGTGYQRLSATG